MTETPRSIAPFDKRLAYIGNICTQWAGLEYKVAHCIWYLLSLDAETGKIVTGGLDMQPRLNMAINLARHLGGPKPLLDQLIATRSAVQDKLDTRRNRAVHGVQFWYPDDGVMSVEVHRGKGGRDRQPVSDDELYDLGNEIHAVGKALFEIIDPLVRTHEHQASH